MIRFAKDVSFLNKPALIARVLGIPTTATVLIDGTRAQFIDHDIGDAIEDFLAAAPVRGIRAERCSSLTPSRSKSMQTPSAFWHGDESPLGTREGHRPSGSDGAAE